MAEEKKIIIDEDWKSQVQAEKDAAEQKAAEPEPPVAETPVAETPVAENPAPAETSAHGEPSETDPPMPPASIGMLMSSLATEALLSMGHIPHPVTGETIVRRNQAKYLIDTLDLLKEKTAGNLSSEEAIALDDVLHQLRMAFVAAEQRKGEPSA